MPSEDKAAGTLSAEDAELCRKLRVADNPLVVDNARLLFRDAAARIEALARERDEALIMRNDFATRNAELWVRANSDVRRAEAAECRLAQFEALHRAAWAWYMTGNDRDPTAAPVHAALDALRPPDKL